MIELIELESEEIEIMPLEWYEIDSETEAALNLEDTIKLITDNCRNSLYEE